MSSRALRKLQREQEEQKQLAQLAADQAEESDESEEESSQPIHQPVQKNAFDFLNEDEDEDQEEEEEEEEEEEATTLKVPSSQQAAESEPEEFDRPAPQRKSKTKGKKKKKAAAKAQDTPQKQTTASDQTTTLDEIDLALKELKVKGGTSQQAEQAAVIHQELQTFYDLLAVDPKHLNPLTELKRLFGSTVLEVDDNDGGRRRPREARNIDLATALTGRYSPVSRGQCLSGLALRKNALLPGKEDWPKSTSGGLSMAIVEKMDDFTVEYCIKHNDEYRRVQREFDICVESMDPQRMISHLQYNPYHISTLLQTSEIAKQQGDHSVASDLTERALFNFGRSAQSTFGNSLSEGKARLDFRRPENRELWLSAWKYIQSLCQRGTWRTAYEWSKLVLSLDPEYDPYRMRMIIDQLAIRGGQFEQFISLVGTKSTTVDWGQNLPSIQISLAMAHYRLKHAVESRNLLSKCVQRYPWIFESLFKELNIEKLPKSIWGKRARTPMEELQTASYVTRAKDIWGTPEALSFLVEVVESTEDAPVPEKVDEEITREDARHIILSDIPSLISHVPRAFTTERTSSSDPLPPSNTFAMGGDVELEDVSDGSLEEHPTQRDSAEARAEQSIFQRLISRFGLGATLPGTGDDQQAATEALERALQDEDQRDNLDARLQLERQLDERESEMLAEALARSDQEQVQHAERVIEARARAAARAEAEATTDSATESAQESASTPSTEYDDQANQRWLAGRGMLALKEFVTAHGADETTWKDDLEVDSRPATEFAFRVMQLKQRSSRDFILNYSLPQGAGKEAGELIKRMVS